METLARIFDNGRIPFGQSLRLFWHHLIPIALLPTVIICVLGLSRKPALFWAFVPLFYGCGYYAAVPVLKKNATYVFWMFACMIWVLGAIPGGFVFAVLKKVFSS